MIDLQVPHPRYHPINIDHDFMVVFTQAPFELNEFTRPIPLVKPSDTELASGHPLQTSGYGYSEIVGISPGVLAETLQYVNMEAVTDAVCKQSWPYQTINSRTQCAQANEFKIVLITN